MRSRLPCSHLTSLGRVDHHLGSGSKICWVVSLTLLCGALTCANALAQEAAFGVAMPLTITGGILDTGRAQMDSPSAPRLTAGFRALAVPEVKLGSHWYAYSAVQVRSTPFFYEDAYSAARTVKIDILQGVLGYTRSWHQAVFGMRIGQLTTAFGSFPLRYSDTANPLLDQPLAYTYLRIPKVCFLPISMRNGRWVEDIPSGRASEWVCRHCKARGLTGRQSNIFLPRRR